VSDTQPPASPDAPNPFPGPRPYRAEERALFHGRAEVAKKLMRRLLAHPCVTLYGPSGSGKSSVMFASVIPALREDHAFRTVRVDGWPADQPPAAWLARALYADLDLGPPPALASTEDALAAVDQALSLAAQRSDRPILVYLDQVEQLLFPGRSADETRALIEAADRLAHARIQGLSLVLAMREDYLGRFRDRARGRPELLDHGFRLGPLTVAEMTQAVRQVAFENGQSWEEAPTRKLMADVRAPGQLDSDEAEVQAAFGQIVCRALWERRQKWLKWLNWSRQSGPSNKGLPSDAPSTVAGVPLETGERVLYFQKTGRSIKLGWILLSAAMMAIAIHRWATHRSGWLYLVLASLFWSFRGYRIRRTHAQADIVTSKRVIVKGVLNQIHWMPISEVADVRAKRPFYMTAEQVRRLDLLPKGDPEHWSSTKRVIVVRKDGAQIEMAATRAYDLAFVLILAMTTGKLPDARVPYEV
jgi:hypothetical protein